MTASVSGLMRRHKESGLNVLLVFVTVQILCIAGALLFPDSFRYLSPANISVQLKAIPVLGIMALGVGVLMVAGEFDLSVGANYTITAVVLASLVQQGWSVYVAAPLILAIGVLIGLLNGADHAAAAHSLVHRHPGHDAVLEGHDAALQRRHLAALPARPGLRGR